MSRKKAKNINDISFATLCRIVGESESNIHFIGVGGISMYSLASVCLNRGMTVTGSDRESSERTEALIEKGANIFFGHSCDNVVECDLVVYSHAISDDNPELTEARKRSIPTVTRAEFLGALMMAYPVRIGVSGTHGKSTTVAMLDSIFETAGLSPTVLSGAGLSCGEPYKIGSFDIMIYEACEYRDSFLNFFPTVAIGLNLEMDHPDYFSDIHQLRASFKKALARATNFSIICNDDENFKYIKDEINSTLLTFGRSSGSDYRYDIIGYDDSGFKFKLYKRGEELGEIKLNIPGEFNIANATAASAVALEYGIDFETVKSAIESFQGIERRLEYIGQRFNRPIFYDYAHHPTEIAASINALKLYTRMPLTVIFKPHTYSRTKELWTEICHSLSLADYLILTDIYPAREEPIKNVSSDRLAEEIGNGAIYCPDTDVTLALDIYTRGAVVVMGAGDMSHIKFMVLNEKE